MFTSVAGLLLAAVLALAPGLGAFLQQLQTPVSVTAVKPSPTIVHRPAIANPSPRELAVELVGRYEAALNAAKWTTRSTCSPRRA